MGFWERLLGSRRTSSSYNKGVRAEKRVKASLERKGWFVRRSKGSRGAADLHAFKDGRRLAIQVKSGSASPTRAEIRRLRTFAKQKRARAMVARVRSGKISPRFV